ncbi:hypothetical protein C8A05DRAFT_29261 [Staphylotrichum tortipilum]|uniref:Uncharacterized protein n=1 Tax=Staphylotrichum tortipilum TaxID=2831512 RepID=A0AAN6RYH7_9PEZI|nr:hypothetical protein C8A05DRAFT_29261 [Staphylotrichum longicolle]
MRAQHFSFLLLGSLASACPMAGRQAPTTTVAAPSPSATPAGNGGTGAGTGGAAGVNLAAAIQAIMPSSSSCSGASKPDECRTAEQAAPFISKACSDLAKAECAATIALMGLESGDMKYKRNLVNAGQGTANMMSPTFISEYATELFGADKVAGKSLDDVLSLVTPDETNFASAAWYLTRKCSATVRSSLATGTDAGWVAYNQCIGVDGMLSNRVEYWNRAKKAFGL